MWVPKGKSFLNNLTSFYDKVTHLLDGGKTVNVVSMDFSQIFDTVPFNNLLEKLSDSGMSRFSRQWVKTGGKSGLKGL